MQGGSWAALPNHFSPGLVLALGADHTGTPLSVYTYFLMTLEKYPTFITIRYGLNAYVSSTFI